MRGLILFYFRVKFIASGVKSYARIHIHKYLVEAKTLFLGQNKKWSIFGYLGGFILLQKGKMVDHFTPFWGDTGQI